VGQAQATIHDYSDAAQWCLKKQCNHAQQSVGAFIFQRPSVRAMVKIGPSPFLPMDFGFGLSHSYFLGDSSRLWLILPVVSAPSSQIISSDFT
jgi:hypothetical protein